jgi:hypothetical protein
MVTSLQTRCYGEDIPGDGCFGQPCVHILCVFCAYFWASFAFESGQCADKGQLLGPKKFVWAGELRARAVRGRRWAAQWMEAERIVVAEVMGKSGGWIGPIFLLSL